MAPPQDSLQRQPQQAGCTSTASMLAGHGPPAYPDLGVPSPITRNLHPLYQRFTIWTCCCKHEAQRWLATSYAIRQICMAQHTLQQMASMARNLLIPGQACRAEEGGWSMHGRLG